MIGEVLIGIELRKVPTRHVRVDAVHEGGVVAHVGRQRGQEVAHTLLSLHLDIEIAHHHDAAVGPNALLAAGELTGLHVALQDVDAVLLVEGHARHLVEAHNVVLADQSALPVGVVHEHLGHGGLAAGNQVGVGRDLLEQVALAGPPRAELHHVVVALNERHHPSQGDELCSFRQRPWL